MSGRSAVVTRAPRRRPAWVPEAERDVVVWLVLAILIWIEATWDLFAWHFLGPDAVKWTGTRLWSEALIQGIPQNAVGIGMTLAIAAALGWWDGLGFGHPRPSLIALILLVPTTGFAVAGVVRAADAGASVALLVAAAVYYVVQPAGEEIVYRGFLLHGLRRRLGDFLAVAIGSALFALTHFVPWGWPITPRAFALHFGFGVAACAIRITTRSLWYPIVFHGVYNLMWTTYGWLDVMPPEYVPLWYWARSIRALSVAAMVLWLGAIVLVWWFGLMERTLDRRAERLAAELAQPTDTTPRMPKS
jgi:membrane protease YdiL (CAAX protease family)